MRKNRFTIDELLEELREPGLSAALSDVKYAVLENSGQLSVLPWTAEQPPTAKQLGLSLEDETDPPHRPHQRRPGAAAQPAAAAAGTRPG